MSKIRIKKFGPIEDGYQEQLQDGSINEWLDIKKATVFIGNQGSGKSTVAKVISTMMWLEKGINRGDVETGLREIDFQKFFEFQNLKSYFKSDTVIDYIGDLYRIEYAPQKYTERWPRIYEIKDKPNYTVPKIMYVPSERNFLSIINNAFNVRGLPEPLFVFAEELKIAQSIIGASGIALPVNNISYKYDEVRNMGVIYGEKFNTDITTASSGFQSLVPLYLVSYHLSNAIAKSGTDLNADIVSVNQKLKVNEAIIAIMNSNLSNEKKIIEVEKVKAKYISKCFVNIVEEPEQNLFPSSQSQVLYSLLAFNNLNQDNKLIITTHSPYIINFLSIAIQAAYLKNEIVEKQKNSLLAKLYAIIPENVQTNASDVQVYEFNEANGIISRLPNTYGIPSDNNELNRFIKQGNNIFDSLLELEEEL